MTGKPLLDYGLGDSKLTENCTALCLHAALTGSCSKTISEISPDQINRLKMALVSLSFPYSECVCTVLQDEFTHQLAQFTMLLKNYTPP